MWIWIKIQWFKSKAIKTGIHRKREQYINKNKIHYCAEATNICPSSLTVIEKQILILKLQGNSKKKNLFLTKNNKISQISNSSRVLNPKQSLLYGTSIRVPYCKLLTG